MGSADYLKFELGLEFMCAESSAGRRRRDAGQTNGNVNDILAMDVCPAFASDYETKWTEMMTDLGLMPVTMSSDTKTLAENIGAPPSRFILLQYILDILWSVPMVENSSPVEFAHLGQGSKFFLNFFNSEIFFYFPSGKRRFSFHFRRNQLSKGIFDFSILITNPDLEYVINVRSWVLDPDNSMNIDMATLETSFKDWLLQTVTEYSAMAGSSQTVADDLKRWIGEQNGNAQCASNTTW